MPSAEHPYAVTYQAQDTDAPAGVPIAGDLTGPAAGTVAAYARDCLTAARPDRDWFRACVTALEAAGDQIMISRQPDRDMSWRITDWRTGEVAAVAGNQPDYDAAWRPGWTDVEWIGSWLEDFAERGEPAQNWPGILPVPDPPGDDNPPRLGLGLPPSLLMLLEETIDAWALAAGTSDGALHGRAAQVAELTGWSEDRVLACTASWLALPGDRYMAVGDAP